MATMAGESGAAPPTQAQMQAKVEAAQKEREAALVVSLRGRLTTAAQLGKPAFEAVSAWSRLDV